MTKSQAGWIKGLAKYAIALLLLGYVVSQNWSKLKELFSREPHYVPLLIAGLFYVVILTAQYLRWYVLVRAVDLPFTVRNAFRLGMVGTFYNTFLPGSIGGDVVKAVFIAKGQKERKAAAVATVVADRLLGLFGLLLFGAAVGGGFWLSEDPNDLTSKIANNTKLQAIVLVCVGLVSIGLLGFVGLGFMPVRLKHRFSERLKKLPKVGKTLDELWFTYLQYWARPKALLAGVALSAVAHTAMMLSFHFVLQVFPPDPSLLGTLPEHFVILPIGFIIQAGIPVPGGLGGGEIVFGKLYELLRGPSGEAVGLAGRLTLRLVEWSLGLVGYIAYLRMKDELPVTEEQVAELEDPGKLSEINHE